jgi:hypothetical protein
MVKLYRSCTGLSLRFFARDQPAVSATTRPDFRPPYPPHSRGDRGSKPAGRRDVRGQGHEATECGDTGRAGAGSLVTGSRKGGCQAGVRCRRSGGHITRRPFLTYTESKPAPVRPLYIPLRFHRAGCYKESELLVFRVRRCAAISAGPKARRARSSALPAAVRCPVAV